MTYLIKEQDGTERSGLSEQNLIELAESGAITRHTAVKKALMAGWIEAEELKFLKRVFERMEEEDRKKESDGPDTYPEQKTAFEKKYIPVPANILLRFQAWIFDAAALLLLFSLLSAAGTLALYFTSSADRTSPRVRKMIEKRDRIEKVKEEKKKADAAKQKTAGETQDKTAADKAPPVTEQKPLPEPRLQVKHKYGPSALDDAAEGFRFGSTWLDSQENILYVCLSAAQKDAKWCPVGKVRAAACVTLCIFLLLGLLYLLLPLMFKAQTRGMHYFGIFLSDADDPDREVLENRAFWFCIFNVFTFYLTPFFAVFGKQNIAERLTKTRVIRISSLREK